MSAIAATPKVSFRGRDAFWSDLQPKVLTLVDGVETRIKGFRQIHTKAAIISIWAFSSYLALVFFASALWQVALIAPSMVLSLAAVGFCIMHDGNHGSFAKHAWANRAAGLTLELLGGCSLTWKKKHNDSHHGAPNVDGIDDDIAQPPFLRLASSQEWKPWHKYQHLYVWPIYCLVFYRWLMFGDALPMLRRRISRFELKVTRKEWTIYLTGKAISFGWAIIIPWAVDPSWHRLWLVLMIDAVLLAMLSFTMSIVFQLAHCVDEALFISVDMADENGKLPYTIQTYQVLATTNFRSKWKPVNRALDWFLGGLNYQILHHLFPKIAHVHYKHIVDLVAETCEQHSIRFVCHKSLWAALKAHWRHLKNMSRQPVSSPPVTAYAAM